MAEVLLVTLFGASAGVGGGLVVLLLADRFRRSRQVPRRRPQAVRTEARSALRLATGGARHGDH